MLLKLVGALIFMLGLYRLAPLESVFLNEGDPVTLDTDVETDQQEKIKWYFQDSLIAEITGDLSYTCTDVQCNTDNERFRDRLKVDHQTGSLTIRNSSNTDSGDYTLQIIKRVGDSEKIFRVSVQVVSSRGDMTRVSVNEGESVTLDPGGIKKQSDVMLWYFSDSRIAKITGDQSRICTDHECKERFGDRLKVDNQTGSLTITNTTDTDSGLYQLQISNRISVSRSFQIEVGSGLSPAAVAGISASVVILLIAAAVSFHFKREAVRKSEQHTAEDWIRAGYASEA